MKKVIATFVVGALLAVSAIGCSPDTSKKSSVPAGSNNAPQVAQTGAR